MDFDDLLFNAYKLFKQQPKILQLYQERFKYIFVDEYQDTNPAQYQLILLLTKKYRNLCVVGDDDQSIYAFRGADVQIIMGFKDDFKDAKIIKLEQNYRSTGNILAAANQIIKNNNSRNDKKLWTEKEAGENITYYRAYDQRQEAAYIANEIKDLVASKKYQYSDFAILYRINALSRNLESALLRAKVPFHIFSGMRFYERKEIKDVLAYLRLIIDSNDNLSFARIINTPKRAIGPKTVTTILEIAKQQHISALVVCLNADKYPELASSKAKLLNFVRLLLDLRKQLFQPGQTLKDFIEFVQNRTGLIDDILNQVANGKEEAAARIENLKEMLSDAFEFTNKNTGADIDFSDAELVELDLADFIANHDFNKVRKEPSISDAEAVNSQTKSVGLQVNLFEQAKNEKGEAEQLVKKRLISDINAANEKNVASSKQDVALQLREYLEMTVLNASVDNLDASDYVTLMTLHSAKGLEFKRVYLIGMEENIFPGKRALINQSELEEERRLAYVGVTRAREHLTLCATGQRLLYGNYVNNICSRFLTEIPPELIDEKNALDECGDYDLFEEHDRKFGYRTKQEHQVNFGQSYHSSRNFGTSWQATYQSYPSNNKSSRDKRELSSTLAKLAQVKANKSNNSNNSLKENSNIRVDGVSLTNKKVELKTLASRQASKSDVVTGQNTLTTSSVKYKVGMRVKHSRLGEGKITNIEPVANDSIIVIALATGGTKRFLASTANLQIL